MVAIRRTGQPQAPLHPNAPVQNDSRPSRSQSTSAPLPRKRAEKLETQVAAPTTLLGRIGKFFRDNDRAVAGVLLGAAALPAITGCATGAMVTRAPSPYENIDTAQEKWATFQQKAAELNAKKGEMSYTELVEARKALYTEYVQGGGTIGVGVDEDGDGLDVAKELLFGTSDSMIDSDGDKMSDGYEVSKGLDPADKQLSAKADVEGWTHGYIPMSNNPMIEGDGLLMYDLLIKERTGTDPAMRHIEGRSALAGGHYFLSSTLSEKNAELTTGMDFNGDGVLTPGVEHDFLKPGTSEANFGKDGKFDETLSVGWWGHCNDVAVAGIQFSEPKHSVTLELSQPFTRLTVQTSHGTFHAEKVTENGEHTDIKLLSGQTVRLKTSDISSMNEKEITEITFSPSQIKELLAELVHRGNKHGTEFVGSRFYGRDATITLTNGSTVHGGLVSSLDDRAETTDGSITTATGFTKDVTVRVFNFETGKYENKTFQPEEISKIVAENKRDVAPITFHETMLKWIGSDAKAGVMDKDAGTHVWNYSFDRYELEAKDSANDPNTVEYEMKVYFVGNSYPTTYNYQITYEDGVPASGKWDTNSPNPDFFWREKGGIDGYDHHAGSKATPLDYDTVMELYKKSIDQPTSPASE